MPLLLDTGPIYALADADDEWHIEVRDFLKNAHQSLLAPVTVIPEITYLLRKRLGHEAEARFIASLAAGDLALENLAPRDVERAAELLRVYNFLGFVDASIVAIAERLKLRALVTTDRRDFSRVRPNHVSALQLLP